LYEYGKKLLLTDSKFYNINRIKQLRVRSYIVRDVTLVSFLKVIERPLVADGQNGKRTKGR
jgi:hypothetical protein